MLKQMTLDASETLFFQRETEHVKTRVEEVKYPQFNQRELIPVSFEAEDADTITYYQYDVVGMAKILANLADDLPRISVKGQKFTADVKPLGDSYEFDLNDIRKAKKANKHLDDRLAKAAKLAITILEHNVAFFGDTNYNLQGLLTNTNIPTSTAPADGTSSSTAFADKDPDKIIRDINSCINSIGTLTKKVEIPDTLLISNEVYTYISSTPRSSNSDTTILQFILKNNTFIKQIVPLYEFDEPADGWSSLGLDFTGNLMLAYRRSDEVLTLEIPNDFEQRPPQEKNLAYITNCIERIGGVIIYKPLAINIMDGI